MATRAKALGALLAFPPVKAAAAMLREMASFESAGVSAVLHEGRNCNLSVGRSVFDAPRPSAQLALIQKRGWQPPSVITRLSGSLVGSVCAAFYAASLLILPSYTSVLLAIAVGLFLTGAFHEDGLAGYVRWHRRRPCTGKVSSDRERFPIGNVRYAGLEFLMLALKAESPMGLSQEFVIGACVAGHGLSRLSSVFVIATSSVCSRSRHGQTCGSGRPFGRKPCLCFGYRGSDGSRLVCVFPPFITCIRSLWSGSRPYSYAPFLREKTGRLHGGYAWRSATSKRAWILYGAGRMGLILLRHTTPDVQPGICYGQLDLDVAATFDAEADKAFAALPRIDRIVTSPLKRRHKLAEVIVGPKSTPL